jgi:hypothetical protein
MVTGEARLKTFLQAGMVLGWKVYSLIWMSLKICLKEK